LTGTISLRGLQLFLDVPERVAGNIESYVIDLNRRAIFISRPHGNVNYGQLLGPENVLSIRSVGTRYRNANGISVLATAVPVPGLPWYFVTEVPVADALGPLRNLRTASLAFEALLVGIILGAALLVASGIVAPVRRLVEAARRVAGGELGVQVPARGADEIAELGHTFNEMTRELSATSARIRELHQREIQRAQQLATVGELASGIAHEIKNPLVGVSNGLDLVRRRMGEEPELAPILTEMARQLTRMESAIRDLLAFARPATPALMPAEPDQIARRALRLIEPAAQHAGVEISFTSDRSSPDLQVDPELIEQALVNVIMNAVQATPPGGRVRVSVTCSGAEVHFRITDTGRGITPADLEHIFKPFYTTRHSGTGLGLSITHDIIERHGGRIEVETQLGEGSAFDLILPVQPASAGAALQEAST
jgi:signal transduction histidine kinase